MNAIKNFFQNVSKYIDLGSYIMMPAAYFTVGVALIAQLYVWAGFVGTTKGLAEVIISFFVTFIAMITVGVTINRVGIIIADIIKYRRDDDSQ